jgi:predicted anti-sigma-YlaC factor YlaD
MKMVPSRLVCQQAVALESDFLEGLLSRRDRPRLEKHIAQCDACTTYLPWATTSTIAERQVATPDDVAPKALDALTELSHRFHDDE